MPIADELRRSSNYKDNPRMLQSICAIIAASKNPTEEDAANASPMICEWIAKFPSDTNLMNNACAALRNLLSDTKNHPGFLSSGCIEEIAINYEANPTLSVMVALLPRQQFPNPLDINLSVANTRVNVACAVIASFSRFPRLIQRCLECFLWYSREWTRDFSLRRQVTDAMMKAISSHQFDIGVQGFYLKCMRDITNGTMELKGLLVKRGEPCARKAMCALVC